MSVGLCRHGDAGEHGTCSGDDEGEDHQLDAEADHGTQRPLGNERRVLEYAKGHEHQGEGCDDVELEIGHENLQREEEEGEDREDVRPAVQDERADGCP